MGITVATRCKVSDRFVGWRANDTGFSEQGRAMPKQGATVAIRCNISSASGQALACYDKALAAKPNHARGMDQTRHCSARAQAALAKRWRAMTKGCAIKPDHAEAWNNRGNTLQSLGRGDESLDEF